MTMADVSSPPAGAARAAPPASTEVRAADTGIAPDVVAAEVKAVDAVLHLDVENTREKFIPVTRFALMDRLTIPSAWPAGEALEVRRFFR